MTTKNKTLATVAMMLTMSLTMASCTEEKTPPVVGSWQLTAAYEFITREGSALSEGHPLGGYTDCTVTFADDGSCQFTNNGETVEYQWTLSKGRRLTLDDGQGTETHNVTFSDSDRKMYWSDTVDSYPNPSGERYLVENELRFERMSSNE